MPADEKSAFEDEEVPERIGRYQIGENIGSGSTGEVFRGRDEVLKRDVAVKLPRRHLIASQAAANGFLAEARTLASLDHPNILPIFDVGRTDAGLCYLVCKLYDHNSLKACLSQGRPTVAQAADVVRCLAEALQHAHQHGLIHRDVKPDNVLVDAEGRAVLAGFDLALHPQDFGKGPTFVGTIRYMSPEQARFEGHRVDARTDVYSLGVVFYEMLTGRLPFDADQRDELLEQIKNREATPVSELAPDVPRELERICLKAMAKRAADRYGTAKDMADDLRTWQSQACARSPDVASPPRVVPRGLRSFGREDSDFFLDLLPGPRNRDGLPESIAFWKTRLESSDPDVAFRVGAVYGPSGCGKSSLLRAGLLPRLGKHVRAVYVEASAEQTETRLVQALRRLDPEALANAELVESLQLLRRNGEANPGTKVVVVLDQFEQWLNVRTADNTALTEALRQCDGVHVQCLLLVRDDFWLDLSRFMRELEVPLYEGQNTSLVDLFDLLHTRAVLTEFGRAFGRLPEKPTALSPEQEHFLDQAVEYLAQKGKVSPVQLSLFAELVKGKPWSDKSLNALGGSDGFGLAFLEETFSAAAAPVEHRLHEQGARSVLKALLPEQGTDIKGRMRSAQELRDVSGYTDESFTALMRILDQELRMVTPTSPDGQTVIREKDTKEYGLSIRWYQLTHDYLVPALRRWLTRKQRETRKGRAELRLAECAAAWKAQPGNRYLPTWWEWLSIRLFTRRQDWSQTERGLMGSANRYHLVRTLMVTCVLAVLGAIGVSEERRLADVRHQARAQTLVSIIRTFRTSQVEEFQNEIKHCQKWARPLLEEMIADPDTSRRDRLHARLVLLPLDETQVEPLAEAMLSLDQREFNEVRRVLRPHLHRLVPWLEATLVEPAAGNNKELAEQRRARAAAVLLQLGRADSIWPLLRHSSDPGLRTFLIQELASSDVHPKVLIDRFAIETDVSVRRAILLVLGDFTSDQFPVSQREEFIERMLVLYREDPDAGLHAACGLLLRRWGQSAAVGRAERSLGAAAPPHADRGWQVNREGMTMVRIPAAAELLLGSPVSEPGHHDDEAQRHVRIDRPFLLGATEVTVAQFLRHRPDYGHLRFHGARGDEAMLGVGWYAAARYCRWLSEQEGMPEEQMCYPPQPDAKPGMVLPADYLSRTGYRLPTDDEWEYACRAGATTARFFGDSALPLHFYAWYSNNSNGQPHGIATLKPNDWGLFDVYGNAWEWTDGWYDRQRPGSAHVLRGGSFGRSVLCARSSERSPSLSEDSFPYGGFRVARTAPESPR